MRTGRLRTLLLCCLLLAALPMALALALDALTRKPSVQRYLLERLSATVGYYIRASEISLEYRRGLGIQATGLEIRATEEPDIMTAARARISLDVRELIRGRIVPDRIELFRPEVTVSGRPAGDKGPPGRALPGMLGRVLEATPVIRIAEGMLRIEDPPVVLEDLDLDAERTPQPPSAIAVGLKGTLRFHGEAVPLTLKTTVSLESHEPGVPFMNGSLETGEVPWKWFPWGGISVQKGNSRASVTYRVTGEGRLEAAGRVVVEDAEFDLNVQNQDKHYQFSFLGIDFESTLLGNLLDFPSFRVSGPQFYLNGSFRMDMAASSDPVLFLRLESSSMPVRAAKAVCPTPVMPGWIHDRLCPALMSGKVRLEQLVLNGRVSQLDLLGAPGNADAFSLRVGWKDLALKNAAMPWAFEGVPGQLVIEQGTLRITGVKGRFGGSVIDDGRLEMDHVFGPRGPSDVALDGRFDLPELRALREKELVPGASHAWFDRIESVTGTLDARVNARFGTDWKRPRLLGAEFRSENCSLVHKALRMPVRLNAFEVKIDDSGMSRFQGRGFWGRSEFDVGGWAAPSLEEIHARISGAAVPADIVSSLAGRPAPFVTFQDPVACSFTLDLLDHTWSYQGKLGVTGMAVQTDAFRIRPPAYDKTIQVRGNVRPGEELRIDEFHCRWGESLFDAAGSLDLKPGGVFSVAVRSPGIRLEDLGFELDGTAWPPRGELSGAVRANGHRGSPLQASLAGRVDGRGVSLTLKRRPVALERADFGLELETRQVQLHDVRVAVDGIPLRVRGTLNGWDPVRADLKVDAENLDAEPAVRAFRALIPGGGVDPHDPFRVENAAFHLNAKGGRWRNLAYGPVAGSGTFREGGLQLRLLEIHLDRGMVSLTGSLKDGKTPDIRLASHIQMRKEPVQDLLQAFGIEKLSLEGPLTLDAKVMATGADKAGLISDLSGNVSLIIEKGRITRSNVMMQVLNFLSLQKIWKGRPPDMSREGLYFNSIGGRFTIDGGVVKTEDLAMESPAFNAVSRGTADLGRQRLDSDLGVQPLGTIDLMVSNLPIVGYILTGEKGALLIYHFEVKGPLLGPEVRYMPLEDLPGGIANFFKRIFLTPDRLIRKIPEGPGGFTPEEIRKFEEELWR